LHIGEEYKILVFFNHLNNCVVVNNNYKKGGMTNFSLPYEVPLAILNLIVLKWFNKLLEVINE